MFWFDPADPFTLGIIRVLTGSMLVYNLLVWGLDLNAFFASDGLQPLSAMSQFHQNDLVFSFLYYVSDEWLVVVHWSCVILALMFCLGLATRLTSVLAFLITISYSQRVPIANFGLDQILGMLCLYLAIGPSGAAVSIDQLIRDRWSKSKGLTIEIRKYASARTALRLIQIHMCVIYFWAGFAKLKGDTWWTGEAMWQVMANQEYQTLDLTWMAWVPWLPYLIAHITVVWEVFFCVLIWNQRLRPLLLAIGTGMHFGIGAFLGMWTFGLIMTYGYFAFGNPQWWRRRLSLSGRRHRDRSDETRVPIDEVDSNILPQHASHEWDDVATEIERPTPKSSNALTGTPRSPADT
ncbi:MAG: HTTM domain-containing protein [Fuerstiella sp.]